MFHWPNCKLTLLRHFQQDPLLFSQEKELLESKGSRKSSANGRMHIIIYIIRRTSEDIPYHFFKYDMLVAMFPSMFFDSYPYCRQLIKLSPSKKTSYVSEPWGWNRRWETSPAAQLQSNPQCLKRVSFHSCWSKYEAKQARPHIIRSFSEAKGPF